MNRRIGLLAVPALVAAGLGLAAAQRYQAPAATTLTVYKSPT
jgi:hypothetical protein